MTNISELHSRWSKDANYKDAYDALGEEFDLARALINARTAAGLSQSQRIKVRVLASTGRWSAVSRQPPLAPGRGNRSPVRPMRMASTSARRT